MLCLMVRELRRWNQTELAERLGVTQSCVSKIEAGRLDLTADALLTLIGLEPLLCAELLKNCAKDSN